MSCSSSGILFSASQRAKIYGKRLDSRLQTFFFHWDILSTYIVHTVFYLNNIMVTSELPAMRTHPKFIFFTDFDGTITLQDSE